MALDIKPTRSELINLKRRIKQTKNGYKLLKMKRDGLFHEFRTLLSDMIKAKRELTESYVLAKSRIDLANAIEGGGGRDHNHLGFTCWLAGGGFKGGTQYGATDEFGHKAVENKTHMHDLHATILHLLGMDHTRLTYRYSGRDFRLTDVHGEVVTEIIA